MQMCQSTETKQLVNDGANETKAMEETKIDERNITDNRARQNKNKVKREKKKDGNLKKIYVYSQLLEEDRVGVVSATNPLPLLFPPIPLN